jgi:UDP-N-acetylmuramoyl-tripeptide--D-alanyl-D-alanine ligase
MPSIFLHLLPYLIVLGWSGYYLITALQWYSYRIERILFHFHRPAWHILYLIAPVGFLFCNPWVGAGIALLGALFFKWQVKEGAKLTKRVKLFLGMVMGIGLLLYLPLTLFQWNLGFGVVGALLSALILDHFIDKWETGKYYKQAFEKLERISPVVVGVTGSYGKTSIKHFLAQLLSKKYRVYFSPGSVNTLKGIIKDINTNLPEDTQIYIGEAGARQPGDIKEIVDLIRPHYAILGKIGAQHLEYFKSLENIIATKLEIFTSPRLKKGVSYQHFQFPVPDKVIVIEKRISDVKADLSGVRWKLEIDGKKEEFFAPVLGEFNAINISLAIYVAKAFLPLEEIKKRVAQLKPVPHRLQKIEAGGKIVIDDSFNGNLEGVLKSFQLVKQFPGKKIIVTPGLLEVPDEFNQQIADHINEIFDYAIITGEKNRKLFQQLLKIPFSIAKDKKELEKLLATKTFPGNLILFSNDFPPYL